MNGLPLSPEAQKAREEAAIRNSLYSQVCECNHQRRQHGKYKCFGDTCRCRAFKPTSEGAVTAPPPTQETNMSKQQARTPARWSDFDKYLKAEHLGGKAHVLTIARVEMETTHPQPGIETISPVLYFRETNKGLILTPTNQDALKALFGDGIAGAIGQKVTLKAIALKVAGRETNPIRISAATSAAPANGQVQAEASEQEAAHKDNYNAADREALFGEEKF